MTDPYYQDERVTLWHGNCLDVLRTLPDASVDSVVTDPPYNLSAPKGRDECLSKTVAQIVLPDDHERDSEGFEGGHLARPSLGRSHLSGEGGAVRVSARVGVPEGAVDLDGPPVIKQEVDASDEPAALTTDGDLTTVGDPQPIQLGGHYVLQRADGRDAPFCDGTCRCFTEPGAGLIAVSVVVPCPSCGDGARDGLAVDWRDAHVGLQYDTRRQAECAACVLAGGRAVVRAVLRLDMRSGTGELSLTDGAPQGDALFLLRPAGSVGARAGAGGLSAMPETHRICLVGDPADRAFTLHLPFHTYESTGGFMGKEWDGWASPASFERWCRAWARECLRVLKPGGHMLAFGGTRTWHRLACAVEDAGFEVRDSIAWLYGSGFPKSLDVSKAIDKRPGVMRHKEFSRHLADRRSAANLSRADVSEAVVGSRTGACWNWEHHQFPEAKWWPALRDLLDLDDDTWGPVIAEAERQKIGTRTTGIGTGNGSVRIMGDGSRDLTANATDAAQQWAGWGTALKPAFEPVVVARKPLAGGTVAANVLAHGTGALNVDGCRVEGGARQLIVSKSEDSTGILGNGLNGSSYGGSTTAGRWPANVVLDEHAAAELDRQSGVSRDGVAVNRNRGETRPMTVAGAPSRVLHEDQGYGGQGGASRFFYTAKATSAERPRVAGVAHPTVKPLDLMRWLVRLVTPPGGTVLDTFAGSGTTGEAAALEGFDCILIEKTDEYLPLILARIHRQRDPIAHARLTGGDLGLFELDEEPA